MAFCKARILRHTVAVSIREDRVDDEVFVECVGASAIASRLG